MIKSQKWEEEIELGEHPSRISLIICCFWWMASKCDEVRYGCYSNMFLLLDKSSSPTWFYVMLTSIRCPLQFSPLAAAGSLMLAIFFLNNDFCGSEHFKNHSSCTNKIVEF